MNRKKAIAWLYGELPALERAGVLSREAVENLESHYGPLPPGSRRNIALLLFSILGATLIGLGIILLLAHNWEDMPRPVRTVLSFLPLLAGQAVAGWTLLRRPNSTAWREGGGMFLALAVGACISLISQTYHIQGDMSAFLLTWLVLGGPVIYLLNSSATALLYMAGATAWAGAAQYEGGQALLFWALAAFLAPHVWLAHRHHPDGARVRLLSWGICAVLPIATGLVLERSMPGLWIVVYSALLCMLLLVGRVPFLTGRFNPFLVTGFAGSAVLTLILTYEWAWRNIGWNHYRYSGWAWQDYLFALALLSGVVLLAVRRAGRKDWIAVVAAGLPLLAVLGFAASSLNVPDLPIMAVFNVYALLFGVVHLLVGLEEDDLLTVNAGMAVMSMLIVARFFDSEISFTVRGVLFIVLGMAFLGANLVLVRRVAARREAQS